jgi:vesicle-fusing ATPase
MNIRQNLFGQSPRPSGRPSSGQRDDTPMSGGYDDPRAGGYPGGYGGGGGGPPMPSRPAVGRQQPSQPGRRISMRIAKVEDKTLANQYIFGNM